MGKKKVLLGFSGGIDSTHAAGLLAGQGYEVTALTLDTTGDREMIDKAQAKAFSLGIPFIVADVREEFETKVVGPFISEYLKGRTPSPCCRCNRYIKWRTLHRFALEGSFDHISTGHYFNISRGNGKCYVAKAADAAKDQSYYLWELSQDILQMVLTPMGTVMKKEVVDRLGPHESRKESMGVCFLAGRSCSEFLRQRAGHSIEPGKVVDRLGETIGRHDGCAYYTIGQKKGLDLPRGYCITGIDAQSSTLTAGTDNELYHHNLVIGELNCPDMDEILTCEDIEVKVRGLGRNPKGFCKITPRGERLHIQLREPAWACAAGQPVVLYRGERVVGGGYLENYF